jgi:hypothetical protein
VQFFRRGGLKYLDLHAAVSLAELWKRCGNERQAAHLFGQSCAVFNKPQVAPELNKAKALLTTLLTSMVTFCHSAPIEICLSMIAVRQQLLHNDRTEINSWRGALVKFSKNGPQPSICCRIPPTSLINA